MKIVINKCFGGFSLSALAVKRMAELNGKDCFFFSGVKEKEPVSISDCKGMFWSAYDTTDLSFLDYPKPWHEMSSEEKDAWNNEYSLHSLPSREIERTDKLLIQVIEELGSEAASGQCAELEIIEIPDGINYEIEEYDGFEHIAEKHRTWG